MELKLNIYEKKEIIKTYTEDSYNILFGTVEDLINIIDFDKIKKGTDEELIKVIAPAIPKLLYLIKPLLKDIFSGLTDEELKKCRVAEIAKVIVNLIISTMQQVGGGDEKN